MSSVPFVHCGMGSSRVMYSIGGMSFSVDSTPHEGNTTLTNDSPHCCCEWMRTILGGCVYAQYHYQ